MDDLFAISSSHLVQKNLCNFFSSSDNFNSLFYSKIIFSVCHCAHETHPDEATAIKYKKETEDMSFDSDLHARIVEKYTHTHTEFVCFVVWIFKTILDTMNSLLFMCSEKYLQCCEMPFHLHCNEIRSSNRFNWNRRFLFLTQLQIILFSHITFEERLRLRLSLFA